MSHVAFSSHHIISCAVFGLPHTERKENDSVPPHTHTQPQSLANAIFKHQNHCHTLLCTCHSLSLSLFLTPTTHFIVLSSQQRQNCTRKQTRTCTHWFKTQSLTLASAAAAAPSIFSIFFFLKRTRTAQMMGKGKPCTQHNNNKKRNTETTSQKKQPQQDKRQAKKLHTVSCEVVVLSVHKKRVVGDTATHTLKKKKKRPTRNPSCRLPHNTNKIELVFSINLSI